MFVMSPHPNDTHQGQKSQEISVQMANWISLMLSILLIMLPNKKNRLQAPA